MSTQTLEKKQLKLKRPPKYSIVFHNNNFTPFQLVVTLLMKVFNYTEQLGIDKATEIHTNGKSVVFINSKEICELKLTTLNAILHKLHDKHLKVTLHLFEGETDA